MAPEVASALITSGGSLLNTVGSLLGGSISQGYNERNMYKQAELSKDLMKYQWNNFMSPEAQVSSLAKAGISPQAFVEGKGSVASPSVNMPSSQPVNVGNLFDIGSMASYIQSVASAKKAGMDTKLSEQEIKNKEVQRQVDEFELSLKKEFGRDSETAKLANAYMQLILSADQSDINELEKIKQHWDSVASEYVAQTKESERDAAKQRLDNLPLAIELENRLVRNQGTAAAAAANASNAQAEESRASAKLIGSRQVEQDFFNEVRASDGVKDSLVTQMKEYGKQALREGWLTYWQVQAAEHAASQAAYADDMKQYTYWINQINSIIGSVAGGAAAFGALRHFSVLDKALGKPKVSTTENYNAFGELSGTSVTTSQ